MENSDSEYSINSPESSDNEEIDYADTEKRKNMESYESNDYYSLQSFINEKYKLLKDYDNELLDYDIFLQRLNKNERNIHKLNIVDIDKNLLENEFYFLDLLNEYSNLLKRKNIVSENYKNQLGKAYENLVELRSSFEENDSFEPLNLLNNQTSIDPFTKLIELEELQMKKIAKQMGIPIPLKKNFVSIELFNKAEDEFYNNMLKYF